MFKKIIILLIVCFATVFVAEQASAQSVRSRRSLNGGMRKKHRDKKKQKKRDWASVQRSNAFYHSKERRSVNKYGARGGRSNKTLRETRARSRKKTRKSYHATKSSRKGGGLFRSRSGKTSKVK